jgi:putative ABC transport system permease protein
LTPLDSIQVALDSFQANPLRSVLTALGIIVGVAAVIAMAAVGAGAEQRIARAIHSIGSDILVIHNGTSVSGGRRTGQGSLMTLTEEDVLSLRPNLPSVLVAAGSVAGTDQVVYGNKNWPTTLRGVTPEYFLTRNWTVIAGRNMMRSDERSAAKVALLGQSVVDELFDGISPIGQTIRIKRVPFRVIGVMGEKGNAPWGGDQDDVVFMPMSTAKKRVFGGRQLRRDLVGQITVKVEPGSITSAEQDIRRLLRHRHHLTAQEPDDFFVRNVAEVMEAKVASSRAMSRLLASVAGISLLVGGIGIMNIMLVSVTERTREIGLRIAVGARRRDIMTQFVIEALLLSMIGGLVGSILGMIGSFVISYFAEWPVLISPYSVLVGALFSAAVGIFFGYYPARKAAQLDPIEALRSE